MPEKFRLEITRETPYKMHHLAMPAGKIVVAGRFDPRPDNPAWTNAGERPDTPGTAYPIASLADGSLLPLWLAQVEAGEHAIPARRWLIAALERLNQKAKLHYGQLRGRHADTTADLGPIPFEFEIHFDGTSATFRIGNGDGTFDEWHQNTVLQVEEGEPVSVMVGFPVTPHADNKPALGAAIDYTITTV